MNAEDSAQWGNALIWYLTLTPLCGTAARISFHSRPFSWKLSIFVIMLIKVLQKHRINVDSIDLKHQRMGNPIVSQWTSIGSRARVG